MVRLGTRRSISIISSLGAGPSREGCSIHPARQRIHVTGIVQGVGFRPFVYQLARSLGIRGYVRNTAQGLVIDAEGPSLSRFLERVQSEAPALSKIETLTAEDLPLLGYEDFTIGTSLDRPGEAGPIAVDSAACPECLRETMDPKNRRYLYPFTNCTNCGPRYSIILGVPYDRVRTTMFRFAMCPECEREYRDPSDRRFHAQPNACPVCGPQISFGVRSLILFSEGNQRAERFESGDFFVASGKAFGSQRKEALRAVIAALKGGAIVALKGLGGFHLACDATNDRAVRRLRERKRGSNKPFALMVGDPVSAKALCEVSEAGEEALLSPERPIVLLPRLKDAGASGQSLAPNGAVPSASFPAISEAVAPANGTLGLMLPYTPLHYLLFHGLTVQGGAPNFAALVMTSGNLSEEPIVMDNREAPGKLEGIADAYLFHDREIHMRVDDSVVREAGGHLRIIRRSRGYVPEAVHLNLSFLKQARAPEILACGADLKSTFCLLKGDQALLSQHLGDMENPETANFFRETLQNMKASFRREPRVVVHDLHPDYLSTGLAHSLQAERRLAVQHHHAHIASCMAEHGLEGPALGVAFDGAGYGTDGTIWGGEFLIADYREFRRVAHLAGVPLPGGDRAAREPWRMAVSYLRTSQPRFISDALGGRIEDEALRTVLRMAKQGIRSPLTSSAGRLFDAVAALLGLGDRITFEGEAAIALEHLAAEACEDVYPYSVSKGISPQDAGEQTMDVVDFSRTVRCIVQDLADGVDRALIAAKFHNSMAAAVETVCRRLRKGHALSRVVLSGGVFQNRLLLEGCFDRLERAGFEVYAHKKVPTNDGGISLGQAVIAAAW